MDTKCSFADARRTSCSFATVSQERLLSLHRLVSFLRASLEELQATLDI